MLNATGVDPEGTHQYVMLNKEPHLVEPSGSSMTCLPAGTITSASALHCRAGLRSPTASTAATLSGGSTSWNGPAAAGDP
jgi:hypothetical protein